MILVWEVLIWILPDPRSVRKRALPTLQEFWERMYDGIEYRGFGQDVVEELAKVCRSSGMEWSYQ